jgi:hypothetical protein
MEFQIAMMLLGLGLLVSVYLWIEAKMEIRRQDQNWRKEIEQIRFQLEEQKGRWIQLARREETLYSPRAGLRAEVGFPQRTKAGASSESSWGNSTRMKAIEMVRRGETSAKISAALSIPKPEVEFLMKIERATAKV